MHWTRYRHTLKLYSLLIVVLALAGCQVSPLDVPGVNADPAGGMTASPTEQQASTPETATETLEPTAPHTDEASAATDTPAPTTSPDVPSPTEPSQEANTPSDPAPTPTPASTAAPSAVLEAAGRALSDGDYAASSALLEEALRQEVAEPVAHILTLAQVYLAEGRASEALATLEPLGAMDLSGDARSEALAIAARAHSALGDWPAAIEAYSRFLDASPVVADTVHWRMAEAYQAMGDVSQAIAQLQSIDLSALAASRRAEILEETAELQQGIGDYEGALASYGKILEFAQNAPYRALILYQQGAVLRAAGRGDEAAATFAQVVTEYPDTYAAGTALAALDEWGTTSLSDLERGEIYYHAGQPQSALTALQQALPALSGEQAAQAHYLVGRAYADLEQYSEAFAEYDVVIEQYAASPLAAEALLAKASAAVSSGGEPVGIYHEFARLYSTHPSAPETLWRAATYLQSAGDWGGAASYYQRLASEYPENERVEEAAFRQALAAYAQGDASSARAMWEALLPSASSSDMRARVLTWLGIAARAAGDETAAQSYWGQGATAAPLTYYSLRSRDLAAGVTPRLAPAVYSLTPAEQEAVPDWQALEGWVSSWAAESDTNVSDHPLAQRAAAFQWLGALPDASANYYALRDALKDDPRALLALAQLAEARGIPSLLIATAERLLVLGNAAGQQAPDALLRMIYPTTFGHLVASECETRGVDPLLFFSLVRQESRFDPWAVSYAGATGLTQVMPQTGEWIASQLGEDDYRQGYLTRPVLSVRYGVYYLAMALEMYDGDWIAALVAYNAGPGSVKRWTDDQPIADHDLFYETIPYQQSKDYVRLIYQQYNRYRDIYRNAS